MKIKVVELLKYSTRLEASTGFVMENHVNVHRLLGFMKWIVTLNRVSRVTIFQRDISLHKCKQSVHIKTSQLRCYVCTRKIWDKVQPHLILHLHKSSSCFAVWKGGIWTGRTSSQMFWRVDSLSPRLQSSLIYLWIIYLVFGGSAESEKFEKSSCECEWCIVYGVCEEDIYLYLSKELQ